MTIPGIWLALSLATASFLPENAPDLLPPEKPAVRWVLVELHGHSIQPASTHPIFLELDFTTGHYRGFAGCNQIMGHFETGPGYAFKFTGIATAKVGCNNPARVKQEAALAETMVRIDGLKRRNEQLQFFIGRQRAAVFLRSENL